MLYNALSILGATTTSCVTSLFVELMADGEWHWTCPRRAPRRREGFVQFNSNRVDMYCAYKGKYQWIGLKTFILLCTFLAMVGSASAWFWISSEQNWVEEEDVRNFEHLIDVMVHNDLGAIEELPIIIEAGRRKIEGGLDSFLSSGAAEGRWQLSVVDKSNEVLNLYREAMESVYEVTLRGRSLMRDMVDHNIDEMQRAFDGGKYEIVHMRLGDVREELAEAHNALETAKAKLKNAAATTDDILKLINIKLAEKVSSAEDAKQGWGAGYSTALYTFGMTVGAVAAVVAPYAIPVAYGVAAGAGLTGFYQFKDALERQNLQQRFYSEARELSIVDGKVRDAGDIIQQCVLKVIELDSAVHDAKRSTEKMTGYLRPEDAERFRTRLSDAKRNYRKLLGLYEDTVKRIQSGSFKPKRLAF